MDSAQFSTYRDVLNESVPTNPAYDPDTSLLRRRVVRPETQPRHFPKQPRDDEPGLASLRRIELRASRTRGPQQTQIVTVTKGGPPFRLRPQRVDAVGTGRWRVSAPRHCSNYYPIEARIMRGLQRHTHGETCWSSGGQQVLTSRCRRSFRLGAGSILSVSPGLTGYLALTEFNGVRSSENVLVISHEHFGAQRASTQPAGVCGSVRITV
jgi:hypothetical protein